jgi:hypothetical protein
MPDDVLIPPGTDMDPGDIFLDMLFPTMKWPPTPLRAYPKHEVPKMGVPHLPVNETELKPGDIIKVGVSRRTIMLISDGCEIESTLRHNINSVDRRHWLAAPLDKVSVITESKQLDRLRKGTQPNKLFIPADERLGGEEMFVDLRRITPVNCAYFLSGDEHKSRAICTLGPKYKNDLKAKILEFFTGLAILSFFECPNCHEAIDTKDLIIPYEDQQSE